MRLHPTRERESFAFKLYCAHFCARHALIKLMGSGPLAASALWRRMDERERAPWYAVAETATARADEQAAEARETARTALAEQAQAALDRVWADLETVPVRWDGARLVSALNEVPESEGRVHAPDPACTCIDCARARMNPFGSADQS